LDIQPSAIVEEKLAPERQQMVSQKAVLENFVPISGELART
jgi:hypothetical protein